MFGTTPNTVEKYLALVERICGFPWSSAPKPEEASEARIWNARVALLNAIFYEPREYLKKASARSARGVNKSSCRTCAGTR